MIFVAWYPMFTILSNLLRKKLTLVETIVLPCENMNIGNRTDCTNNVDMSIVNELNNLLVVVASTDKYVINSNANRKCKAFT